MQRPLAVLAAAACGLLLLSVVANLIAIQKSDPARTPRGVHAPIVEPSHPDSLPKTHPVAVQEPAEIIERAQALTARLLQDNALGPLGEASQLPYTAQTRVLMESKASGRWVTLTEVRAPCADVDRALGRIANLALGQPDRCERWVETTAAVLERHGVSRPSAREFLVDNDVETNVRVLLLYAGWRSDADGGAIVLASSGAAPVYPRDQFMEARTAALDTIYRTLRLGPYAEG
jgi:hypothetical protein